MILLEGQDFPASTEQLAAAVHEPLGRFFALPAERSVVEVAGDAYPALESFTIDLTDAQLRESYRPAELTRFREPAVSVARFRLQARPLRQNGAAIHFEAALDDARFEYRRDVRGRTFLVPSDGLSGRLFLRGNQVDFREMILSQLRAAAAEYGVAIEKADWTLTSEDNGSLRFESRIRTSKKLLVVTMGTTLRTRGRLIIDEALNLRFADLSLEGDGLFGSLVVALAQQYLRRLESTTIALTSFSLGRLKLRDLHISCTDEMRVEAAFGS